MNELITEKKHDDDNAPEARSKWPKRTCIVVFIAFLICTVSFGQPPIIDSGSAGIRIDYISSFGILFAIVCFALLLFGFRNFPELSWGPKMLGTVGAVGLIAHAAFAIFHPLPPPANTSRPVGTSGYSAMGSTGPYEWTIDGQTYLIDSTYYLGLREGLQFTIQYSYPYSRVTGLNDSQALDIVFPLIKYAYSNDLHRWMQFNNPGGEQVYASRIGVVLAESQGSVFVKTSGYRVALTLEQIKQRIAEKSE